LILRLKWLSPFLSALHKTLCLILSGTLTTPERRLSNRIIAGW